eukprot:GDKI01032256.1.p1 GENE.GDKI01032256.1~~GDKI01032256.1.p1  ORF type:complete len:316 (+),score=88.23 GDKI01032256.1:103-1050(+)
MASPQHIMWAGVQVLISLVLHSVYLLILPIDLMLSYLNKTQRPAPKHVLITGATSGIGEALAVHYAAPGVTLSVTGRNTKALEAVVASCKAKGATVNMHVGSVTEREALAAWIVTVDAQTPIDLIVANAGVTEGTSKTEHDLEAAFRVVFDTNVTGVANTIFPALDNMRKRGAGHVVIIASLASFGALASNAAYAASKSAVRMYGEGLRAILAREGVAVTVVCPGFVESPMTAANKFPQPGIVTMDYAVEAIAAGVARNDAVVAFPFSTFSLAWIAGAAHPVIRDFLARNRVVRAIAYWRKKDTRDAVPAAAKTE